MTQELVEKIKANPSYQELVTKRTSFSIKLAIVMLVMYYAFILLIAFNKEMLGQSFTGGVTTIGIPMGLGIIVFSFILTGIYTQKANGEFDDLSNKIKDDIARGGE